VRKIKRWIGILLLIIYPVSALAAGGWMNVSCNKAKNSCIGTSVCVSVAGGLCLASMGLAFPLCIAAGVCGALLSQTYDFCGRNCSDSATYCTGLGQTQPFTDPTIAATCCDGPVPKPSASAPCPSPSSPPDTGPLDNIVPTLNNAGKDMTALDNLGSGSDTVSPKKLAPMIGSDVELATAGDTVSTGETPQSKSASTGGGVASANGNSSGSSSGSNLFGGLLDSGPVSSPSAGPSASPSSIAQAEDASGLYGTGSGSFNGRGGEGGVLDPFGSGLSGGSGGANTVKFGADAADNQENARQGDDPEDYFTRIGLGDSIFVIVHKRYQSQFSHGFEGGVKR
jgi:hypothetical protein